MWYKAWIVHFKERTGAVRLYDTDRNSGTEVILTNENRDIEVILYPRGGSNFGCATEIDTTHLDAQACPVNTGKHVLLQRNLSPMETIGQGRV